MRCGVPKFPRLQNLDVDLLQCILQARWLCMGASPKGLLLATGAGATGEASKRRTAAPLRHVLKLPIQCVIGAGSREHWKLPGAPIPRIPRVSPVRVVLERLRLKRRPKCFSRSDSGFQAGVLTRADSWQPELHHQPKKCRPVFNSFRVEL